MSPVVQGPFNISWLPVIYPSYLIGPTSGIGGCIRREQTAWPSLALALDTPWSIGSGWAMLSSYARTVLSPCTVPISGEETFLPVWQYKLKAKSVHALVQSIRWSSLCTGPVHQSTPLMVDGFVCSIQWKLKDSFLQECFQLSS